MKSIEKLNAELIEAAKNGEQDRIAVLVNGGADVNARDKDGYTALHIAAIHNNPESIQKLIDCGANVEARNNHGYTALNAAAFSRRVDSVRVLIANGATINSKNNFYYTPLNSSIHEHKETEISHGKTYQTQRQQRYHHYKGEDPEVIEKINKECQVAALLIKGGAELNVSDHMDRTPGWKIFMYNRESKIAQHLVEEKDKTPAIINHIIKQASGHVHDNVRTWSLVEKIVKKVPDQDRVEIVSEALKEIENPSRQKRLLGFLNDEEKKKVLSQNPDIIKHTRIEKMKHKLLSFMKSHNSISKNHHGHNHHKSRGSSQARH